MDILFLQKSLKNKNSSSKLDMAICPFLLLLVQWLKFLTKEKGVMTWEMRHFSERRWTLHASFIHHIVLNPGENIIVTYFQLIKKKKSLGKGYCASIRGQSHLLWMSSSYCTEYVCMSTQHPSCREKTALPHSIVILLTQMVDKWHRPGQAAYFIYLSTVRDRGCLASCLSCQESVLLLWEDMLTHQLSMLFPLSCVLWSMSSN